MPEPTQNWKTMIFFTCKANIYYRMVGLDTPDRSWALYLIQVKKHVWSIFCQIEVINWSDIIFYSIFRTIHMSCGLCMRLWWKVVVQRIGKNPFSLAMQPSAEAACVKWTSCEWAFREGIASYIWVTSIKLFIVFSAEGELLIFQHFLQNMFYNIFHRRR